MDLIEHGPTLSPSQGTRHVLLVLDGTDGDDVLVDLGSYSAAITGGRISLILLPGDPMPAALWVYVVGFGVHPSDAAEAYLCGVVERMKSAGARVDHVRVGDREEAAAIIDFLEQTGVDVVAASSPTRTPRPDLQEWVLPTGAELVLVPTAA